MYKGYSVSVTRLFTGNRNAQWKGRSEWQWMWWARESSVVLVATTESQRVLLPRKLWESSALCKWGCLTDKQVLSKSALTCDLFMPYLSPDCSPSKLTMPSSLLSTDWPGLGVFYSRSLMRQGTFWPWPWPSCSTDTSLRHLKIFVYVLFIITMVQKVEIVNNRNLDMRLRYKIYHIYVYVIITNLCCNNRFRGVGK